MRYLWSSLLAVVLALPVAADDLPEALHTTDTGTVSFQYDVREGRCADGGHQIHYSDGHWVSGCDGPVTAHVRFKNGEVRDIDLSMEFDTSADRDIGHLDSGEVSRWFLLVVDRTDRHTVAKDALVGAAIARDPAPLADFTRIAADESRDTKLRGDALFWMSQFNTPASLTAVERVMRDTDSEPVKEKGIFAVSQHEDRRAGMVLRGIARDSGESHQLRRDALFWLGQRSDTDVATLRAMYDAETNRDLKRQIIFTLSQREEVEAVEQLMLLARHEPDEELRNQALFWLGQSEHPTASRFLENIILD